MIHKTAEVSKLAKIGKNVNIWNQCQVREGATIGDNCILGKNVYIDKDVSIGSNVKIENNVSVYRGVTIEDNVFIGPNVVFTNDRYPRATENGKLKTDFKILKTIVKSGASIGAGAVILCGLYIGEDSLVGAGSVVIYSVIRKTLVVGNPAREIRYDIPF